MKTFLQIFFFVLLLSKIGIAQWVQTNGPYGGGYVYDLLVSETNLFAATGGGLFCSTDYGLSWTAVNSGLTNPYNKSLVVTSNINGGNGIFASTWGNGIFRSTDNGVSWFAVNTGLASPYISGLVAGSFGTEGTSIFATTCLDSIGGVNLFRSTNSGESWTQINTELLSLFFGVHAINEFSVFVGGDWGTGLQRYTQINTNWFLDTLVTIASVYSLAIDGSNLFVGTDRGVLISNDNGTNWLEVRLSNNSVRIGCILVAGTNIFAGNSYGGIFLSTNNGSSWTEANLGFSQISGQWRPYVFDFAILGSYIFAATEVGVWRRPLAEIIPVELTSLTATANCKEVILNWSTATELNNQGFEVQRKFGSNDFVTIGSVKGHGTTTSPNNYTYVDKLVDAGKYFYRLKQIDFGGKYEYSQIVEVNWSPFTTYKLEQNYPNPFNPTTTIGFGIPENGNARLSVLDILGEEMRVLLNEEIEAGYHSVEFDASDLPSGVYFYKLTAGNFISTRKMLLLK